ncbi:MAG: hypothetical protein ACM30E_10360 [Nitrososphaerales archaeon]
MALRHPARGERPHGSRVPWRWLLIGLAILVLIILTARAAAAENLGPGGGSRLIVGDEIVGAYRLLATSSPNPATTGTVTYVIRVSDPQSGVKVRDAQVEIELTSEDGATVIKDAANHKNAGNDIDYAAHIPVQQAGAWNGVIRVNGSAGSSEVKFLQPVSPPRSISTVILVGIPFLVMLGVFGAMYYVRAGGRKPAAA